MVVFTRTLCACASILACDSSSRLSQKKSVTSVSKVLYQYFIVRLPRKFRPSQTLITSSLELLQFTEQDLLSTCCRSSVNNVYIIITINDKSSYQIFGMDFIIESRLSIIHVRLSSNVIAHRVHHTHRICVHPHDRGFNASPISNCRCCSYIQKPPLSTWVYRCIKFYSIYVYIDTKSRARAVRNSIYK